MKARKWGNSVGLLLPKSAGVKPDEEVNVHIEKTKGVLRVKDIFGKLRFRRSTEEMLREADRELEPEEQGG